jgi:P27 family predicted phage terminase small subunit
MGLRGPIPKPSVIEIAEGRPGKRAVNSREPQPLNVAPPMPAHLDKEARKAWRHVCPILLRTRVLTEADGNILAAYCQVYSTWVQIREAINKKGIGALLQKARTGFIQQSPLFTMERDCIQSMTTIGRELGMSPSARSRIQISDNVSKSDVITDAIFG